MKRLNQNNDTNTAKTKKHSFITAQLVVWLLVMLCCFAVGLQIAYGKNGLNNGKNIAPVSESNGETNPNDYVFDNYYYTRNNKVVNDVVQISTFEDLLYLHSGYAAYETYPTTTLYSVLSDLVNYHKYKLCNDIVIPTFSEVKTIEFDLYSDIDDSTTMYGIELTEYKTWQGIGITVPFYGEFDGNNHTITFNESNGLFYQAYDLTVKNLGIKGTIDGAGGICNTVDDGSLTMTNCYNSATIKGGNAGGLVGSVNINDAYVTAGNSFTIENCYNVGRVYSTSSYGTYFGGLVGALGDDIPDGADVHIKNCYNAGWIQESEDMYRGLRPLCGRGELYDEETADVSGLYFLTGCSAGEDSDYYTYSPIAKTPSELKSIFSNTTGWTQSSSVNGGYPYLSGFADPTTKWLTLKLGTGCTINGVSGEYAIGMDAGQTIDLSTLNISPTITSANLSKTSGGGKLSGTTYTFGSTDGVVTVSAATYTVTIEVNNSSYGSVSKTSVANVPYGTTITTSGSTVTINGTKVTATAATSTSQYTYAFKDWTNGTATVTGATTVTANFTRTTRTYTVTIEVNNSSYGSVSNSSVTVDYGTSITSSNNVLTIGSTKVTANPKASDGQYSYSFLNWTGIPSGGKVVGNVTITAKFTRTEESHSLTIVLKANTEREYIVYILGSNGNPTRQLVMKNGDSYTIEGLNQGEKFSILVAETLYTKCTIKDTTANTTEQTRKKTYESGVSANTNIEITISGAGNVNNWAVV